MISIKFGAGFIARCLVITALLSINLTVTASGHKATNKDQFLVSEVGVYEGYSSAKYKGFKYDSKYLTMRDSVISGGYFSS